MIIIVPLAAVWEIRPITFAGLYLIFIAFAF
jgi:hypothetical protein